MLSPKQPVEAWDSFSFSFTKQRLSQGEREPGPSSSETGLTVTSNDSRTGGLALRYATAVFELAAEERAIDSLAADLASLKALLQASPELERLVRSPLFSREDQARGMTAVLEKAGAGPLARKLVLLLAQKRRLFALSDVIRAFEHLLARQRGEISAEVTSARPLAAAEMNELKQQLKSRLGREPRLELTVDPSLLGGLRLKLGSRMIDSSLRTKLEGLRAAMKGSS